MSKENFLNCLHKVDQKYHLTAEQLETMQQVAKVESGFVSDAVGKTGDYGYCQVTAPAESDVERVCKVKLDRYKDIDNVEIAFLYLFKVLPAQLRHYGVNPVKEALLGAYNMGAYGYSKNGNQAYIKRYGLQDPKKKS